MNKTYYKAFNRDLKCRDFQYEEGKTYKIDEKPVLCEKGFHFCKSLVLTLQYYPVEKITDNKYAEVEVLGDTEFEEPTRHKGVTNKILIKKVLSDEEVLDLVDSRNNSGYWNSGDGNSGDGNSGNRNSGDRNSGYWNSGNRNSGDRNSGDGNSGDGNSGDGNSGNRNSGYWNSGDGNSGYWNSGNRNSGDRNSGDGNSGYWNSGNRNSGDRNSGYWNSGNRNSGDRNSGDGNSGYWNSCNRETGFFNTEDPEVIRVFNKKCPIEDWKNADKPGFIYFDLDEELGYRGSWKKAYNNASDEDIELLKSLPNFDSDVFEELTGIRV